MKKKKKKGNPGTGKNVFREIGEIFRDGDLLTKLSFALLGVSNLFRGQVIKGLLYFTMELGFIFYMIIFGVTALSHLDNLGDQKQGMVFDEARGIYVKTQGQNSMLLLLAAVVGIFIIVVFAVIWFSNIRSAILVQKLKEQGKHIPNFREDIRSYADAKLHKALLAVPFLGILMFNVLPLVFMILIAFTNFDKTHQPPGNLFTWVGLANFKTMLNAGSTIGRTFWPILIWTIVWAVFATFLNYILGMILAIMINRKETRFKRFWRTIFVMSIAVPQFVSLLVMRSMLQESGAVNVLLQELGLIDSSLPFLSSGLWAKVTVIIVNIWVGVPYTMLITTGILQNIPADLYEAARVDGANPYQMFVKITLPYMFFITTPYLITQFVGNINNFNVIFLLTGGGPNTLKFYQAGHTDLLVTWLYKLTVNSFDYSYAAVIGIIVFIISAVLSLITYRNTKSYKNEEDYQ